MLTLCLLWGTTKGWGGETSTTIILQLYIAVMLFKMIDLLTVLLRPAL